MENRALTLLEAAKDLLIKQNEAGVLISYPITVHYDEADCDGYCLLDDISAYLSELTWDEMSTGTMTPMEIIEAVQSGTPLIAPRVGGKRLTLSIVNQMAQLIALEEEYKKLKKNSDTNTDTDQDYT